MAPTWNGINVNKFKLVEYESCKNSTSKYMKFIGHRVRAEHPSICCLRRLEGFGTRGQAKESQISETVRSVLDHWTILEKAGRKRCPLLYPHVKSCPELVK